MLTGSARRAVETAAMLLPPLAVAGAVFAEAPVAWQSAVAAVFFLVSPGLAVLAPARFRWEIELALLVPTSLAVTSSMSLALFYAGVWTPEMTVVGLSALCALGVVGAVVRGPERRNAAHTRAGSPVRSAPLSEDAT